jgi:hypothetical protein
MTWEALRGQALQAQGLPVGAAEENTSVAHCWAVEVQSVAPPAEDSARVPDRPEWVPGKLWQDVRNCMQG